jgi:hypothetical protein
MKKSFFYALYINYPARYERGDVEKILDAALDWYRYDNQHYLIHTTSDEDVWYKRLETIFNPDGYMFICQLDPMRYNGWMDDSFWEWYNKNVNRKNKRDSS